MPRLLETVQTSADRIKASRTVAFELVKLFLLAIQSLPKKIRRDWSFTFGKPLTKCFKRPNFSGAQTLSLGMEAFSKGH
jgi:hypothetical protein